MPATESGARSIVLEEFTIFAELNKELPVAVTPRNPPKQLARSAVKKILPRELFVGTPDSHQGRFETAFLFLGKIMSVSCYNFVATNKPSPAGSKVLTHCSAPFLMIFPASRRATVFGSRWAGSLTFEPPKKLSITRTPPLRKMR